MAGKNVVRREVQAYNDPFGIPACFYWTVDEVADWVESIGFAKYKENFRSHFINGRKLLTVDTCMLPKIGIVDFADILTLSRIIKHHLSIHKNKRYYPYDIRKKYMDTGTPAGLKSPLLNYPQFAMKHELALDAKLKYFKRKSYTYRGWEMDPSWSEALDEEENEIRLALERDGLLSSRDKFLIRPNIQDRLLQATLLEIGIRDGKDDDKAEATKAQMTTTTTTTTAREDRKSKRGNQLPQLKKTKDQLPQLKKTIKAKTKDKWVARSKIYKGPFLPISFCWQKMELSTGYPPLKIEHSTDTLCG